MAERLVELKAEDIIKELKAIIADQAHDIAMLRAILASGSTSSNIDQ